MIDTNEAMARIAVAELEARRLQARSEMRSRRWRLGFAIARVLIAVGVAVYLQVTNWGISGAQACGLLLIYLAASTWNEHRTNESLRTLQAQLDRLKEEINSHSS